MLQSPMDVLKNFPVRRNRKQKESFRESVRSNVTGLGYPCAVENGSFGSKNLVIGDPDSARFLITAHYDTPACMPFPNFITPCNAVAYFAYQFGLVFGMLLLSVVPAAIAGALLGDYHSAYFVWYFTYLGLLAFMMFGPANPNNANDNTSGVVTLLSLAAALPAEKRTGVCFVLFDLEEMGLIGSKSYRKAHRTATDRQIVLNMDCVGDGDTIMAFPTKKLNADQTGMALLQKLCYCEGHKKVTVHQKGFYVYPSDQKNFPYGVGIAAFKHGRHIGMFCDRIHTRRDTVLDENNVNILRDRLLAVITG